jgi:hypothetical protein
VREAFAASRKATPTGQYETDLAESTVVEAVRFLASDCLASTEPCLLDALTEPELVQFAIQLLAGYDGLASLGQLLALEGRRLEAASSALERRMDRALGAWRSGPCLPPNPAEVSEQVRQLAASFAVVEQSGDVLLARAPTRGELEDLAYFYAAIEGAGLEPGSPQWASPASSPRADSARRSSWDLANRQAKLDGDVERLLGLTKEYLAIFGFPDALAFSDQEQPELARQLRSLFRLGVLARDFDAARAAVGAWFFPPQCLTGIDSVISHWRELTVELAELAGHCRAGIPERMLNLDTAHGLEPLRRSGFDVVRLFRGALVTRNREARHDGILLPARDADVSDLAVALATAEEPLRSAALQRLNQRGREDWERRVLAVEGVFDEERGRRLLGRVESLLAHAGFQLRARLVSAIGRKAARLTSNGGCVWGVASSGEWQREITEEHDPELSKAFLPVVLRASADRESKVREAAARALGLLGDEGARPRLTAMLSDLHVAGESCGQNGCGPWFPVRDVAEEALEALDLFNRQDCD